MFFYEQLGSGPFSVWMAAVASQSLVGPAGDPRVHRLHRQEFMGVAIRAGKHGVVRLGLMAFRAGKPDMAA